MICHVTVMTTNLQESIDFYQWLLGLPIARMRSVFQPEEVERRLAKLAEREHESLRSTYQRMLERGPEERVVDHRRHLVVGSREAVGDTGRIGNVAIRQLEQLNQVVTLKTLLRLAVTQRLHRRNAQCALHQRQGNQRCRSQGTALLHHVIKLADIPGPGRRGSFLQGAG